MIREDIKAFVIAMHWLLASVFFGVWQESAAAGLFILFAIGIASEVLSVFAKELK